MEFKSFHLYLFISLKEVLRHFCKVVFFIDNNEKVMSRQWCPENCPRSGSEFGLGLALELGPGAIFLEL